MKVRVCECQRRGRGSGRGANRASVRTAPLEKYILLIRALLLHVQRGCGAAGWMGWGGVVGLQGTHNRNWGRHNMNMFGLSSPSVTFHMFSAGHSNRVSSINCKSLVSCTLFFLHFYTLSLLPMVGVTSVQCPSKVSLRFCSRYCLERRRSHSLGTQAFPSDSDPGPRSHRLCHI